MANMITDWGFGIPPHYAAVSSYNPSSFFTGGTPGPWYDPNNSANTLNGSGTPATNGQTVGTENDSGTAAINATQAVDATRPILATNAVNGRSALSVAVGQYLGVSGLDAFTSGVTSLTMLLVYSPTDASTNHRPFRQYDNGFSFSRFIYFMTGLKPSIGYSKDVVDFGNNQVGISTLSAATYHAIIYQTDCVAGTDTIYVDNASYALSAAGGTTIPGAMNATSAQGSRIFEASLGSYADMYFHKNALMSGAQQTAYFAAVKTRFALTAY